MALHAQAWQLAQHGGVRIGRSGLQCLDRRIPDKQTLSREVAAWQDRRNKHQTKADWRFTTADARIKLKRLYPRFE